MKRDRSSTAVQLKSEVKSQTEERRKLEALKAQLLREEAALKVADDKVAVDTSKSSALDKEAVVTREELQKREKELQVFISAFNAGKKEEASYK